MAEKKLDRSARTHARHTAAPTARVAALQAEAPAEAAAEWLAVASLKPWAKNPRKNRAAIARVADSIKRFGFGAPVLARRADLEVIAGHTRIEAAKRLGITHVPVRLLDLDPAEAHLLAISDNKLGELASWDEQQLAAVLAEYEQQDLALAGFSLKEIQDLVTVGVDGAALAAASDVEPEALPEAPKSERGTLYELGPHRLLCGDTTVVTDLERLVGEQRVDMVFTDPPYNVAYTGGTADALTIQNDQMDSGAFRIFLRDAFASMLTVAKAGAPIYVCHADSEGENFRGAFREAGWQLKQCLIWAKDRFVPGRQDYHWQHEPILYGWAPGGAHRWCGDRKQTTVWSFARPRRNAEHPTMKPLELVEHALENSSLPGDVVLDGFGGSGSTLLACARKGRLARLVELDPRYCDVIRKRWTTFAKSAGVVAGTGALE